MDDLTGSRMFRLLTCYAILMYGVQLATIMLSTLTIRISQPIALSIIGFSIVASLAYSVQSHGSARQQGRAGSHNVVSMALASVICTSIAVWPALLAAAYLAPDVSWDGNAYHIPTIALWDAQGYVHWTAGPYSTMMNGYPKGAELLAYVVVKALGDSGPLNALNIFFLPLGVLGVTCIARSLGASSVGSLFAGLAFVLVPVNISQATTTYVDSAYASTAIAFMATVLAASETSKPRRLIVPLGVTMSLPMAIKSNGLALVGLACAALLAIWTVRALRQRDTPRQQALVTALICLLAALVIASAGGYWYVRNYLKAGTPLYPVGVKIGNHVIFPGISVALAVQETAVTPPKMRAWSPVRRIASTWMQGLGEWPSSIRYPESRWGGLGFLWVAGCLPAIISLVVFPKLRPSPQGRFWIVLALTGAAFLSMPLNWWARYTAWIYALGLPCFAVVLEKILAKGRLVPIGALWCGICLGLAIFEGCYCCVYTVAISFPGSLLGNPGSALVGQNWQRPPSYLFPDLNGTAYDQVVASGRVVAVGPANWPADAWPIFGMMGQISQPVGGRKLVLLSATSKAENIIAQHVDFIVWDRKVPIPADIAALAEQADNAGAFVVLKVAANPDRAP